MKRIDLMVQEKFIEFIDKLVDLDFYPSRSEAIREAIKDWIQKESIFLSNLNSDIKKLPELHRKFSEFNNSLKEQFFPIYQSNTPTLTSTGKSEIKKKVGD